MFKLLKFILLFLILSSVRVVSAHSVHVIVTNIDFVDDSVKVVFAFDGHGIEEVIYNNNQIQLRYEDLKLNGSNTKYVSDYISKNFKLWIGNEIVDLELQSVDVKKDKLWLSCNSSCKNDIAKILIESTLFNDLQAEISNMVVVCYNGIEKGYVFNKEQTKKTITLVE